MRRRGALFLLTACALLNAQTSQTSPSTASSTTPAPEVTIHAETRLVIEDVVVTDKHGLPVTGLTAGDFVVKEDGKPQTVRVFEAHVPSKEALPPSKIVLPAHQFTNFPTQVPSSSISIVLFDTLNTPITDQMYARWQMINFIKALPPQRPVALFSLGHRGLKMIAGFTTSSEDLVKAAETVRPAVSSVDEEPVAAQAASRQAGANAPEYGPTSLQGVTDTLQSGPIPSPGTSAYGAISFENLSGELQEFLFEQGAFRTTTRVETTVQVFNELGRALAGYPGRKNLIWLSEAFPITLSPDVIGPNAIGNVRSYAEVLRESSALLSASQISVYPVDVRGVKNMDGRRLQASYLAMDEIAKQTGGKAFYGTNDLKLAMQQSIELGSVYYTLAYSPQARNWDSRYRRIKITLEKPGLKAEYRPGYFALPEKPSPPDVDHARLVAAMQLGVPESTMLVMRVQVLVPDASNEKVRIGYGVLSSGVTFAGDAEHTQHAKLEFVAVAWDRSGKAADSASQTVDLALKPTSYQLVVEHGVPHHLELNLKPGAYRLRLGVMDDSSGKIGTLEVPLSITEVTRAGAN